MPDKHLSTQFDTELNNVSSRVMELGGLVESQIRQAVFALSQFSSEVADQVIEQEAHVNSMEVEIDRELASIIGRRQPTAVDLRLLMAISKTTANLERVGDEAEKIARMVKSIINSGTTRSLPSSELRVAAEMASSFLNSGPRVFFDCSARRPCAHPMTSSGYLPASWLIQLARPHLTYRPRALAPLRDRQPRHRTRACV